ncbi:MAG: anti-sigma factor [Longimicrobiales bacterium]
MSSDHPWTGWAASYALGALDDEERRTFEEHIETCAVCQTELRAQREVVAGLGSAVPFHNPPPALRDRILDDARRVRPISGRAAAHLPPGSSSHGMRWLAAAAAVAAVALTAMFVRERSARRDLEGTVATLTRQATQMDARIAELDAALAARDSLIAAVLSPDVRTARLAAQGQPPSARIYWNQERGRVVVAAFDLPAAPAGRAYQLWGITGGAAPVSLGVFNTGSDGRAVATFDVPATTAIDVAAITEEPAGGSPQPTSQPFLVGGVGAL